MSFGGPGPGVVGHSLGMAPFANSAGFERHVDKEALLGGTGHAYTSLHNSSGPAFAASTALSSGQTALYSNFPSQTHPPFDFGHPHPSSQSTAQHQYQQQQLAKQAALAQASGSASSSSSVSALPVASLHTPERVGRSLPPLGLPAEVLTHPAFQHDPPSRPTEEIPLVKLTVNLLKTFTTINQKYYAAKKKRQSEQEAKARRNKKPKNNDGYDDDDYNYIVRATERLNNRYRVESVLGKGSFGRVVKCFDMAEQCHVAVKIVKSKQPFYVQAQIEISILKALQVDPEMHNIVRIKDTFMHRNHQCIVTELLSVNLFDLLQNTQFKGVSLRLIAKFAKQLLVTLSFLCSMRQPVIHCDLKPENILLRDPKRSAIKVIDFGSACFSNDKMYTYIQSRFYRAPEVLLGLEYNTPIDMWSLGCILVEMHTGKPLFDGANEPEQIVKQAEILGLPPGPMIEKSRKGKRYFQQDRHGRWSFRQKLTPRPGRSLRLVLASSERWRDDESWRTFEDLIVRMLDYNPETRIRPEEARAHAFFAKMELLYPSVPAPDTAPAPSISSSSSSSSSLSTSSFVGTQRQASHHSHQTAVAQASLSGLSFHTSAAALSHASFSSSQQQPQPPNPFSVDFHHASSGYPKLGVHPPLGLPPLVVPDPSAAAMDMSSDTPSHRQAELVRQQSQLQQLQQHQAFVQAEAQAAQAHVFPLASVLAAQQGSFLAPMSMVRERAQSEPNTPSTIRHAHLYEAHGLVDQQEQEEGEGNEEHEGEEHIEPQQRETFDQPSSSIDALPPAPDYRSRPVVEELETTLSNHNNNLHTNSNNHASHPVSTHALDPFSAHARAQMEMRSKNGSGLVFNTPQSLPLTAPGPAHHASFPPPSSFNPSGSTANHVSASHDMPMSTPLILPPGSVPFQHELLSDSYRLSASSQHEPSDRIRGGETVISVPIPVPVSVPHPVSIVASTIQSALSSASSLSSSLPPLEVPALSTLATKLSDTPASVMAFATLSMHSESSPTLPPSSSLYQPVSQLQPGSPLLSASSSIASSQRFTFDGSVTRPTSRSVSARASTSKPSDSAQSQAQTSTSSLPPMTRKASMSEPSPRRHFVPSSSSSSSSPAAVDVIHEYPPEHKQSKDGIIAIPNHAYHTRAASRAVPSIVSMGPPATPPRRSGPQLVPLSPLVASHSTTDHSHSDGATGTGLRIATRAHRRSVSGNLPMNVSDTPRSGSFLNPKSEPPSPSPPSLRSRSNVRELSYFQEQLQQARAARKRRPTTGDGGTGAAIRTRSSTRQKRRPAAQAVSNKRDGFFFTTGTGVRKSSGVSGQVPDWVSHRTRSHLPQPNDLSPHAVVRYADADLPESSDDSVDELLLPRRQS